MKNLIFIAILALFSVKASAQSNIGNLLSVHGLALDTVTNTAAETMTLSIPGSQGVVTITAQVTEISGTTAGNLKLYGSFDGTTDSYALIDSAATFNPADVTTPQNFSWRVVPSAYVYYRVIYTGVGTMAAKLSAKALWRK